MVAWCYPSEVSPEQVFDSVADMSSDMGSEKEHHVAFTRSFTESLLYTAPWRGCALPEAEGAG